MCMCSATTSLPLFSLSSSPTSCNLLTSLFHLSFVIFSLPFRYPRPHLFHVRLHEPLLQSFVDSPDEGSESWSLMFSFGV